MILMRIILLSSLLFFYSYARTIIIQKSTDTTNFTSEFSTTDKMINIAVISAPGVIGKYTQSVFNVSEATLIALKNDHFQLKRYDIPDESAGSLSQALEKIRQDGMDAIVAPLTSSGAKNLITIPIHIPVYIPTVHKRDLPDSPENIVFGGIDYSAQIEALLPYMGNSISIFYDNSSVGTQLKTSTEEVFLAHKNEKKRVASYPIDIKGDNIVTYLAKPSLFNKSSVIIHIPVVKSALLAAHITFSKIKVHNILSTQINVDPTLLTLTQYQDRKNIILANSLIEFPNDIYESNALMNNDITFDWIQYSTSVGIDYLIASLSNTPRKYTMRIINSQVIYPVELLHAKEYGFEPFISH
ncbi:hypothetical protein [Sulfuricurvum sp.]|uniref:hypothetical protein n=1 Tax=Sulfuricurvum sp. TaxID=2025608 RepID=UPI00260166C5|nr:hypothetical protein [Sulfuricurvum sp.]MDD2266619.1 hypothetical protein [Sulfuricurvum sp.]MDD2784438.1 hypothetical protein [Sulfuricurvum sp.]